MQKACKLIVEWYTEREDKGHAIILAGGYGVGKSHIGEAIKDLYGYGAKFVNELDLCEKLQGSYDRHSRRSQEELFFDLWQTKLLIYDGLGEYRTSNLEWMQNIYHKLFTGRFEAGKGYMITTNLDAAERGDVGSEFRAHVGNKNFSRIFGAVDDPRFYIDLFGVPDYRLKNFR